MKTFLESMQVKAKDNFVESAFFFMHNNGVNPKEFVDWYGLELVHMPAESHKEFCENWLNESFGNWVGQKVGSVVGNVAKNVGGFVGGVGQGAMNSMMPNTQGQAPINSPQQYPAGQKPQQVTDALQALSNLSKYAANYPQDFYNALHSVIDFLNQNNFRESIKQDYAVIIEKLQEKGVNPKEFTEWFLTEGMNLNEEGFWQGLKDTVGAGWAGLKNVANNFGNNMATAGNQYLNQKQMDRTNAAREQFNSAKVNAIEALKKLNTFLHKSKHPNYADVVQKMRVIYKAINQQPVQTQQPQDQQQQTQQQAQAQQLNPQQQNQQYSDIEKFKLLVKQKFQNYGVNVNAIPDNELENIANAFAISSKKNGLRDKFLSEKARELLKKYPLNTPPPPPPPTINQPAPIQKPVNQYNF